MKTRTAYAVAWAVLCALVLSRVPGGFGRVRFRIVTSPVAEQRQSIAVPLPDLSRLDGQPAAIILRLRGATEAVQVRVSLDGATVSAVTLPAGRQLRLDASARFPAGRGHELSLTGDRGGWRLDALEIANVHGHSDRIVGFTIVPRDFTGFARVPIWWLWPIVLGLLAFRRRSDWPNARIVRLLYFAGVSFVLLLFAMTLVVDRLTPFKVLLAMNTFLLCAAIVHADHLAALGRFVGRTAVEAAPVGGLVWRETRCLLTAIADWPRAPALVAGAASIAVLVAALVLGNHVAGGADAYGYVSQSALWARGQLYVDQPIAAELPEYVNDWVIAPLGFVPQSHSGVRGRIVPLFSPGLPMVMAAFRLAFGPWAVFLVVPILSALAVWLTFVAGRRLGGNATGLTAALWLAVSPAFLASAFAPMSDVPAATWWLAALVASFRPSAATAAATGLSSSLAVLTRPNLAPLAAVVALPFMLRWLAEPPAWRTRGVAAGVFLATAAIGPIVAALIFNELFGSPFRSGYGTVGMNVDWSNVLPNLNRYPRWLIASQTFFIVGGLAAPFLLRRRTNPNGLLSPAAISWLMLAASAIVWLSYLLYFQFDSWMYLRFLLPSYPLLIALASAVLVILVGRWPAPRLVATAVVTGLMLYEVRFDQRHSLLERSPGEQRYRIVGEFAGRTLPDRALLLSAQHSGSLRYYSGRTTLRYDQIPADRLDDLVEHLQKRGYPMFIVLDSWEVDEWRRRFGPGTELGRLAWPPSANLKGSTDVLIYDVQDRRQATPVQTQTIR